MSKEELYEYYEKVFNFLIEIPYGSDYYVVDDLCKSENKPLFVETIKEWMRMNRNNFCGYIEFTADYSKFRKLNKIIGVQ